MLTRLPLSGRRRLAAVARPLVFLSLAVLMTASMSGCAQDFARVAREFSRQGANPGAQAAAASTPTAVPKVDPGAKPVAMLAAADWDIPGGHFYTQTNGLPPLSSPTGYGVTNLDDAPFWTEYQRLGGPQMMGYPLSGRMTYQGRLTQVFQRGILQWNAQARQIQPMNVLAMLDEAGKGDWLVQDHRVPQRLSGDFDKGKSGDQITRDRLDLLKAHPALNDRFKAAPDPIALYGLPDSTVVDQGDHLAIRLQRGVLRLWKKDVSWAKAGDVTADNTGEYAVDAGLFPKEALATQQPPTAPRPTPTNSDSNVLRLSATTPAPSAPPAPAPTAAPAPAANPAPTPPAAPAATPTPAGPVPAQVSVWQVANTDGDGVYLRKSPKLDDKLTPWADGTLFKSLNEQATGDGLSWYKVQAPDGSVGWIPARYVKPMP